MFARFIQAVACGYGWFSLLNSISLYKRTLAGLFVLLLTDI